MGEGLFFNKMRKYLLFIKKVLVIFFAKREYTHFFNIFIHII